VQKLAAKYGVDRRMVYTDIHELNINTAYTADFNTEFLPLAGTLSKADIIKIYHLGFSHGANWCKKVMPVVRQAHIEELHARKGSIQQFAHDFKKQRTHIYPIMKRLNIHREDYMPLKAA
jgi:hypothetical protein